VQDEQPAWLERLRHLSEDVLQLAEMMGGADGPDRVVVLRRQLHVVDIRHGVVDLAEAGLLRRLGGIGDGGGGDVVGIAGQEGLSLGPLPFDAPAAAAQAQAARQRQASGQVRSQRVVDPVAVGAPALLDRLPALDAGQVPPEIDASGVGGVVVPVVGSS
jgi:hypothetical protein